MFSRTLYVQYSVSLRVFPSLPAVLAYDLLSRCKFSTLTSTYFLYSTLNAQSPVLKIHHRGREGLSTRHVQRECSAELSLCAASRVTKDIPMSPWFSPTIFYRHEIQPSTAAVHTVFDAPDPKLITLQIRSSLRSQYKILKCFATQQHYLLQSMNNMFLHVLRECTVVCSMRRTLRSKLFFGRA